MCASRGALTVGWRAFQIIQELSAGKTSSNGHCINNVQQLEGHGRADVFVDQAEDRFDFVRTVIDREGVFHAFVKIGNIHVLASGAVASGVVFDKLGTVSARAESV